MPSISSTLAINRANGRAHFQKTTKVADGLEQNMIGVTDTSARSERGLIMYDSTEKEALGKEAEAYSEVKKQTTQRQLLQKVPRRRIRHG